MADAFGTFAPTEAPGPSLYDRLAQLLSGGQQPATGVITGAGLQRSTNETLLPSYAPSAREAAATLSAQRTQKPEPLDLAFQLAGGPAMGRIARPAVTAATEGVRGWHGSPHSFDRFDMSKLGTGEGQQVYGHGMYIAGNEATATDYRKKLSAGYFKTPSGLVDSADVWTRMRDAAQARGLHPDQAHAIAERIEADLKNGGVKKLLRGFTSIDEAASHYVGGAPQFVPGARAAIEDAIAMGVGGKHRGHMYEVNIKAPESHFLDWDAPLGAQPGKVVDAVRPGVEAAQAAAAEAKAKMLARGTYAGGRPLDAKKLEQLRTPPTPFDEITGQKAYFHQGLPAVTQEEGFARATQRLRDAGLPGLKYLDQGSRARPVSMLDPQIAAYHTRLASDKGLLPSERSDIEGRLKDMLAERAKSANPTRNYVVFDDSLIDIMRKYAMPGMVGGGAAFGSMAPGDQQ